MHAHINVLERIFVLLQMRRARVIPIGIVEFSARHEKTGERE